MLLAKHKTHPLTDLYWRIDPALSGSVLLAGGTSPLWGPIVARVLGWPASLGARLAIGPFGGLLVAGYVHDLLRYRTAFPPSRTKPIEILVNAVFLLAVTGLPLIRYFARRRNDAPPTGAWRAYP